MWVFQKVPMEVNDIDRQFIKKEQVKKSGTECPLQLMNGAVKSVKLLKIVKRKGQ